MSESDSGVEAGSDTESLGEMSVGSSAPSEEEQALPQVSDLIPLRCHLTPVFLGRSG